MHVNLVVTRECVHEAKQSVSGSRVDQHVYAWERKAVFWTGLVQIDEIHAHHPPLPVGLFEQDYIGWPIGVVDFLDEFGLEELLDLISNCCIPF